MARGGKREGAGRTTGVRNKLTREHGATISELAREYTELSLEVLSSIARDGESETARVNAANSLLDRGYGKATQQLDHKSSDGSIGMGLIAWYGKSDGADDTDDAAA